MRMGTRHRSAISPALALSVFTQRSLFDRDPAENIWPSWLVYKIHDFELSKWWEQWFNSWTLLWQESSQRLRSVGLTLTCAKQEEMVWTRRFTRPNLKETQSVSTLQKTDNKLVGLLEVGGFEGRRRTAMSISRQNSWNLRNRLCKLLVSQNQHTRLLTILTICWLSVYELHSTWASHFSTTNDPPIRFLLQPSLVMLSQNYKSIMVIQIHPCLLKHNFVEFSHLIANLKCAPIHVTFHTRVSNVWTSYRSRHVSFGT